MGALMGAGDRVFWSDVADAIRPPACHLVQATGAAQTGWGTLAATAVTFGAGSEILDDLVLHDTATLNTRVIIGKKLGWWKVSGVYCPAVNAAMLQARAYIGKNGAAVQGSYGGEGAATVFTGVTTPVVLVEATAVTDYVELYGVEQAASGTIGTTVNSYIASSLTATWLHAS